MTRRLRRAGLNWRRCHDAVQHHAGRPGIGRHRPDCRGVARMVNRTPGANRSTVGLLPARLARRVVRLWSCPRRPVAPSHNGDCDLGRQQAGAIRTTVRAAWSAQRGPSCNLIAGRRSSPSSVRRSPCVGGVTPTVLDVFSLTCAGWVRSAGGFFVPMPDQRIDAGAVLPRSGAPTPFVKMRVPVCKSPSLGKESDT